MNRPEEAYLLHRWLLPSPGAVVKSPFSKPPEGIGLWKAKLGLATLRRRVSTVRKWKNQLYFGDNLDVLRTCIPDESVDLVYLDPPFNSKATYSVLFADSSGKASPAPVVAFEDTWHWSQDTERVYHETLLHGPERLSHLLQALRQLLGHNDMMAYLVMMAPRLVELRRVMKPTASLYLHCDIKASHYLKLVLDAVFGPSMFRNEIVWVRDPAGKGAKRVSGQWPRNFDVLLLYSRSEQMKFRQLYTELTEKQKKAYRYRDARGYFKVVQRGDYTDESMERLRQQGRVYVSSTGKEGVKYYLDEARSTIGAVWTDIPGFGTRTASKERLGYPTQKPEALLERIIQASSDEGDLVLDPFCGCGTAVAVAERLRRRWIGIDIAPLAIHLIRRRLEGTFGSELSPYEVKGIPVDLPRAAALAPENVLRTSPGTQRP